MKTIFAAVIAAMAMTGTAHAAGTFDPSSIPLYVPKNPSAVFNKPGAWMCAFPTDVDKYLGSVSGVPRPSRMADVRMPVGKVRPLGLPHPDIQVIRVSTSRG